MTKKFHKKALAASSVPPSASPVEKAPSIDPNSIFTLFGRTSHKKTPYEQTPHTVNWYVCRSTAIRRTLSKLWGDGPEDKRSMKEATMGQKISTHVNALFLSLGREGPTPEAYRSVIKLDTKHGTCNDVAHGCISKGFYHCHVSDAGLSYEVMWEAFEDKRLINIVAIGPHENFDFAQKGHKPLISMEKSMEAAKKANFDPDVAFDHDDYNNKVRC